jgi:polyribonucleotide nucleotidyltransferase
MVKVINIDPSGKIRLSRKALLEPQEGQADSGPREGGDRPHRGGDDRRDRRDRRPGGDRHHGHERHGDRRQGSGDRQQGERSHDDRPQEPRGERTEPAEKS